ncbi:RHS repeat-associated core domain-containing protein [Pseudomonas sp. AA27]|uniref:RHS repeat-associated core domain-containing protein n=1 Tax=Pseudomonas sp. AA27 TaxID=2908652 RepID=UPI001F1BB1A4|nr:RHS repeat-associated core domain-containing protein [Pseudomonas sp. AA27]MCF1489215.1 RHS repeat-associated core domain-containing protein [Pseudomonas sp. AA27]
MSLYLPMLDHQRSPFGGSNFSRAYTPYGATTVSDGPMLGFCGQPGDRETGSYPLGNGRRCYSAGVLRFQSPDQLSPFGKGGINAYIYCSGDPVNRWDPSGQTLELVLATTLNLVTARDAGKNLHQTLHARADIQLMQRNSTDPAVLNQVKPTLTREVGETSAVAVPVLGAAAAVVGLAGGPAIPAVGLVSVGVGLAAWGIGKLAKRRENKQAKDPHYYIKNKTGKEANRVIAIQNEIKAGINEDIAQGRWPKSTEGERLVDAAFREVVEAGNQLRDLS